MGFFKKNNKVDQYTQKNGARLINLVKPKDPVAEQIRMIRTNIKFAAAAQEKLNSIMITSPEISDGKSTVSSNLAIAWAQAGEKVLFIDADLRRPTLHATFDTDNSKGLTTILSDQAEVSDVIQETVQENLSIITSGPVPPNPADLLDSAKMEKFIKWAEDNYDFVIFDTPPVISVSDSQILSSKIDGVIVVVRFDKTLKLSLKRTAELLKNSDANILGVVTRGAKNSNNGYGYGYGYGYE